MKTQVKALKVKIKSLAAEAAIIRKEERRALGRRKPDLDLHDSLRAHRVTDVRRESRAAVLAYGFLRGRAYGVIEKPAPDNPPDMARVRALVEKFGGLPYQPRKCSPEELSAWRAASAAAA